MNKKTIKNPWRVGGFTAMLTLFLSAVGCADSSETDVGALPADDEITILIGEDDHSTRGAYIEGPSLLKYAVYSFYSDNKNAYLINSVVTRDQAGDAWKKSKTIKFPNATRALDFYAMAPGVQIEGVTNVMKPAEKTITYELPKVNGQQTDFMFSSLMGQTRTSTNNLIKFNFKHLFSYLRFQSKLSNEKIDVTIHSIRLHNLKSTGTFTMDNNKANTGSWTLADDKYGTYEFVLPKDSVLTYKKTLSLHVADSMLFVLPQKPDLFKFTEGSSFSDADTNNQAYASVLCRIVNKADNSYVGCTATTWAEVYYPIKSATWYTAKQPYGGTYNVSVEFTGGYTYAGADFLQENSDDNTLENESIEGVQGGITSTADWAEDEENSVTIGL